MDSQSNPPLCARACGFFGSVENQNLCSKCYKNYLKEQLIQSATTHQESVETVGVVDASHATTEIGSTPKNRCQFCNKKVGLVGFQCKCGKVFCGVHRYPKEHECTFDYKTFDRVILEEQNPVIKGDKLEFRV